MVASHCNRRIRSHRITCVSIAGDASVKQETDDRATDPVENKFDGLLPPPPLFLVPPPPVVLTDGAAHSYVWRLVLLQQQLLLVHIIVY